MTEQFEALKKDVHSLKDERRARSRSPIRKTPTIPVRGATVSSSYAESTRREWADIDPSEMVDYTTPKYFSDEEEEDGDSNMVEVSDETRKLLTDSCTRSVTEESRKKVRSKFYLPKVPATLKVSFSEGPTLGEGKAYKRSRDFSCKVGNCGGRSVRNDPRKNWDRIL